MQQVNSEAGCTSPAACGAMVSYGDLTLRAGNGLTLHSDLRSEVASQYLVLDADLDKDGVGEFYIDAGRTVNTNCDISGDVPFERQLSRYCVICVLMI